MIKYEKEKYRERLEESGKFTETEIQKARDICVVFGGVITRVYDTPNPETEQQRKLRLEYNAKSIFVKPRKKK